MKLKIRKQQGFSLLEMVVVIFIITMSLLGILSLVRHNIQAQYTNKNLMVATQLAQEGLELIRNKRDQNFLDGNWFCDGIVEQDASSTITVYFNRFGINIRNIDGKPAIDQDGAKLNIGNNDFYIHDSTDGVYSGFNRIITAENNYAASSTTFSCVVQWMNKNKKNQYALETLLYDWR